MIRSFALTALIALVFQASVALAVPITGSYDTLPGFGSATTGTGPWTMTSTDSTFSLLRRNVNEIFTFADLTDLNVVFHSPIENAIVPPQAPLNAGGGGGAPRLSVSLDTNNDNVSDGGVLIHLGTSPSFIDTPATLNLHSGSNLLNNDAGRYDLSQFGGSNFTDYNAALSLVGTGRVLRATVILDSFLGADKTLNVDSINGAFDGTVIPEPSTFVLASLAVLGLVGIARRRK